MPPDLTLDDWLTRLEQLHPQKIDLGLARVQRVAQALNLKPDFPILIVGGTNGKGSTCAYLEAILRAAGYKTGLYTSPHLLRYNERVRIAGEEASDAELTHAFERVDTARADISLTYFEFGTLGAMLQFIDAEVDVAILEVGLGGRLDAVNIFASDAAIVTSVDLDHQAYLGDTREKIGYEKAGIYRAQKPALCADPDPPTSLLAHIAAIGADACLFGRDFRYVAGSDAWTYHGRDWHWQDLPLPRMAGAHQLRNAAGAIALLESVRMRLPVEVGALKQGLRDARIAGRYQRVARAPEIVVDVAHNPEAARALAATLAAHPVKGRNLAVFGILADKDVDAVLTALYAHFSHWYACAPDSPRALATATLADKIRQGAGATVTCHTTPQQALQCALNAAGVDDRIVVFGSFHTVAAVLEDARSRQ